MARLRTQAVTWNTTAGNKTITITPAPGDLIVVVSAASGIGVGVHAVTDDRGGTYSAIQGMIKNASADSAQLFVRNQPVQVGAVHTLTLVQTSSTGGGGWAGAYAEVAKYGQLAIKQSGGANNLAAAGTPQWTIASPITNGRPASGPIGLFVFNTSNPAAITPPSTPSAWSEQQDVGYATPASGLEVSTLDNSAGAQAPINAGSTSATAFGTLSWEIDEGVPTSYGSGRLQRPGTPGELQRRRLPLPAQDFTNTNIPGSITEIAVIGGAVAAGNTPVAVVANTSQGATAGGLTPLPKTVLTAQGALGQGVTPTASTTLTSQGALGQGNTPAPQTILTSQGATGQGVSPVATGLAIFTIQGALAGGAGPGADATPGVGGSTGNGTGPIAVVTFTSQGATAGGVSPVATATAILTIQGATAGGTGPTAVVGVTPGGVTGTGVSSSGSGELAADDFNRTDNADVGSDWTPIPHSPSNTFVIDGNKIRPASNSDDAAEIFSGVVFPDDQYAQGTVKGTFIDRGDGVGIGLCLRGTSAATTYYRIVVQGAGDIGGPDIDISKFVAGVWTDLSLSNAPSNWVDGDVLRAEVQGSGSSVTITVFKNGVQVAQFTDTSGTIASGNPGVAFSSSFPDVFIDDFSAGGLVGGPRAVVGVTPGGALAGGPAPTESTGTADTPAPGGGTAGGTGPLAIVATTAQGATAGGTAPTATSTLTSQGALGAGVGATASSSPTPGGGTADDGTILPTVAVTAQGAPAIGSAPTAVVMVSPGGATAGGTAPGEYYFETPTRGGADAAGNAPGANATTSPGGALAGGPGASASSTVTSGGSLGAGTGPTAYVIFTSQGATGGGNAPNESNSETASPGGAIAAGVEPSAYVVVDPGGALAGGNAPSAPLQENATPGGAIAGGRSPSADAAADMGGTVTSFGATTAYVNLTPGVAIGAGNAPTEIGVTPPTPAGPTPGSGNAKRVRVLHNRIETLDDIRDEDEEEALLLLGLSLE